MERTHIHVMVFMRDIKMALVNQYLTNTPQVPLDYMEKFVDIVDIVDKTKILQKKLKELRYEKS